jgi:hypothetical protein
MHKDLQKRHKATTIAGVLAALLLLPASRGYPQTTQNVEVEPVTCWWRTAVSSVRVGEPFSVWLTCSVLETDAARAVVDRSRLGSAAVQFPPYEVTGGSQSADYVTAGRRFMQYEYVLRLISEDAFGRDVPVPEMPITYRIESAVQQDAALQGREQTYVLPPLPMRVASLVPDTAIHIRESRVPTLAEIASREFRARMFRVVAFILFGVAGLTVAVAAVRWTRQRRTEGHAAQQHLLSHRAVLSGVRRELRSLQEQTRGGWSPDLVGRALAAARLIASYLAGQTVAQRALPAVARLDDTARAKERWDGKTSDGELLIGGGLFRRRRVAVSGSTTAEGLSASRRQADGTLPPTDLEDALRRLTAARYGRSETLESSALDDALATCLRAVDGVAAKYTWIAETTRSARQSVLGWRPRAWAR